MAKTVRLSDIGARLGVSTVTVSKALSGQTGVSDEMRQKIVALADELGYKKGPDANQNAITKSYSIGVMIADRYIGVSESFYLQMYQTINASTVDKGCYCLLLTVNPQMEEEFILPEAIVDQKIDGLIIIGRLDKHYLTAVRESSGIPWILLDFNEEELKEEAVLSDSYYGAYQLTNYLLKKGHRDIAYVGTVLSTDSITDRYMGYLRALMEAGITPRQDWKIDDRNLETGTVDEVSLIQLPDKMPTAFFCNCDMVASILIKKLTEKGYQVPQDISVVGYDNFLYSGILEIGITTYEVDSKKMATKALEYLLRKLKNPSRAPKIHIVEGHIIEKDSVKEL